SLRIGIANLCVNSLGHDHLSRCSLSLQSRGRVDHIADGREVLHHARAHVPHKGPALVDTEAEREPGSLRRSMTRASEQALSSQNHLLYKSVTRERRQRRAITSSPTILSITAS